MPIYNFHIERRSSFPDRIVEIGSQEHDMWSRVYHGATFPAGSASRTLRIQQGNWSVVPSQMLPADWDEVSAILGIDLRAEMESIIARQARSRAELAAAARASRRLARDIPEPLPLPE